MKVLNLFAIIYIFFDRSSSGIPTQGSVYLNKCCPEGSEYNSYSRYNSCFLSKNAEVDITALGSVLNVSSSLIRKPGQTFGSTEFKLRLYFPTNETCAQGYFLWDVDLKNGIETFGPNGELIIGTQYYATTDYCLANKSGEKLSIRVCNPTCSNRKLAPCIKKCCPINKLWNEKSGGCVPADGKRWKPRIYRSVFFGPKEREVEPQYTISHPKFWCNKSNRPYWMPEYNLFWQFRINTEGTVFGRTDRWEAKEIGWDQYCLDGNATAGTDHDGNVPTVLFDCSNHEVTPNKLLRPIVYGVAMILSCIFLLLTILVRVLLWDRQPNHRWSLVLISYAISLFFLYLLFTINYFWFPSGHQGDTSFCYFVGVVWHYSFLNTFAWLSVISFDHWWTFRSFIPTSRSHGSSYWKTFIKYALFPLLFSTSITAVALSLDSLYGNDYDSFVITPNYGIACNLHHYYAQLVYAYGPVGILLILNFAFFVVTIYNLYMAHKGATLATENCSKKLSQKESAAILGKLLVIMGVPWIFEVISWFCEGETDKNQWYWICFDVINSLQGVAIFWIFVIKPDVIRLLCDKYDCFRRIHHKMTMDKETFVRIEAKHPRFSRLLTPIKRFSPSQTPDTSRETSRHSTDDKI